jgi:Cof subfamily protein (haloacid dehalogenase superfamily)
MKYRLIAIDLDGTLFSKHQEVSPANREAVAQAQAAGVVVVPCTGRSWRESFRYLKVVPNLDRGIFNTGAVVAEMQTGRSVDLAAMEPRLVLELVQFLHDLPEAVLVFQDRSRVGRDYLICGGELTKESKQWFEFNKIETQRINQPTLHDLQHSLRVSVVAFGEHGFDIERRVGERFGDQVSLHCFAGIADADESKSRFMVEVFGAEVNKWRGLKWFASQQGIADEHVAAIGDEVNDIAMLRHAGLGIAMDNAHPAAKEAADRTTLSNAEDGVAHAIEQMLRGKW